MEEFKSILFDFSGTLIDDLSVTWRAANEAFSAYGSDILSLEQFRSEFKLPVDEYLIWKGFGLDELKEVAGLWKNAYLNSIQSVKLFPDTGEVLEALSSLGVAMAIVSQTPRKLLEYALQEFRIGSFFKVILPPEGCVKQKPDPEPALMAVKKLGINPEKAIIIGDMVEDILMANSAGIRSVAISRDGSYHYEERLKEGKPSLLIHSFREVLPLKPNDY